VICTITESSRNASSAHFPFLHNKGSSQWRQLRPEWKPQHRSGKNSQEVATPTCCEACDLLWKLTFRELSTLSMKFTVQPVTKPVVPLTSFVTGPIKLLHFRNIRVRLFAESALFCELIVDLYIHINDITECVDP